MLQQSQTETIQQLAQDVVAALEDSESQLQVITRPKPFRKLLRLAYLSSDRGLCGNGGGE